MGDKTPTKGSNSLDKGGLFNSPMTPRKAEKRNAMEASPQSRRALDYDHMAALFNKKPKIEEKDLKEVEIASLKIGSNQQKRLVVNLISFVKYDHCVKMLVSDNSGVLVITAFKENMESLLHVTKQGKSQFQIGPFDVRREAPKYPTANHAGIEVVTNRSSLIRHLGPVFDCDPPYYFMSIPTVLMQISGKVVDMLAIVANVFDNSGSEKTKPEIELSLFDSSQRTICFSVWPGNCLSQLRMQANLVGRVVAIRSAVTSHYGGTVSVQSLWYTQIDLEPTLEEAYDLFGWYEDLVKEANEKMRLEEEKEGTEVISVDKESEHAAKLDDGKLPSATGYVKEEVEDLEKK